MSTSIELEYSYEVITNRNDLRLCAQLLAEEFVQRNDLMMHQGFTVQKMFDDDTWPILSELFDQGLCFLARHHSSGEIVATITAGDLYVAQTRYPYDPAGPPSQYFTFDLLDEMDHIFVQHDFGQELKPNLVLQIIMGATRSAHSGKGVAGHLRRFMLRYARETRGFQYALVQPTDPATRHIYVDKLSGKELTVIDPRTWIWKKGDGSCPLKDYRGIPIPNVLIHLKPENAE